MVEYRVGYYMEYSKYVAQRRFANIFGVGQWRSIGRWTESKEDAENIIAKAKEMLASGVTVID